jgi:hypothetical protein
MVAVSVVERERAEIYALRLAVVALLKESPTIVAELRRASVAGQVKPANLELALPARDEAIRLYLKALLDEAR